MKQSTILRTTNEATGLTFGLQRLLIFAAVLHVVLTAGVFTLGRRTFLPTTFDVGDEGYEQLLNARPAWQALFHTFHSQLFIDWCRDQFAEVWERDGCAINLSEALIATS